jgi:hypothetical protein
MKRKLLVHLVMEINASLDQHQLVAWHVAVLGRQYIGKVQLLCIWNVPVAME